MKIIYENKGGVSVITPSPEALRSHSVEDIANKDVPAGKAYQIIEDTDLPSDRIFRNAWEVDVATLNSGLGAESNEF